MSDQRKKKVWVDLAFVEARAHGCQLTFEIHDSWNDSRKQQPYYVMELSPYEIEYMIRRLGEGLIAIEDHVMTQRRRAIAALKGDDA
ncbi:hypothetical protein LCGC14_1808420 [marine sediment metagenome]|uniref:Uncharacterized protein n=1 Tax=marine sediment metagenome TaxID=412755 RepID=A0A0F9J266_9ZZZZ